jgi:hypothetical protein
VDLVLVVEAAVVDQSALVAAEATQVVVVLLGLLLVLVVDLLTMEVIKVTLTLLIAASDISRLQDFN